MKSILLLIIGILFCGQLWGQESKVQFGINAAPEVSFFLIKKIEDSDKNIFERIEKSQFDFNAGINGRYFFREKLSMVFGIQYQRRCYDFGGGSNISFSDGILAGESVSQDFSTLTLRPKHDKLVLNQFVIPINLEYWFNEKWNIFAGLSFLKSMNTKRKSTQFSNIENTEAQIKELPIGFNFGFSKLFQCNKTAFQVSPNWKSNFNNITINSREQTNFQFSTGVDFTFWFK